MDYFVNGSVSEPLGNRHSWMAPHGAYRCKGEDAWCVIAVGSEEEWESLCGVMGNPAWAREPRFENMMSRHANQDELDRRIEEWTRGRSPESVVGTLQGVGVGAGVVQDGKRLFNDPHLRTRGFFRRIDDPETGPVDYPGPYVRLLETPGRVERCHGFGEDNLYVFGELLDMPEAELRRLAENGVLA